MMRFLPLMLVAVSVALFVALAVWVPPFWSVGLLGAAPLLLLGGARPGSEQASILRNFPIVGHLRYLFETMRPSIHQYFVESDIDGRPFSREQRSLIYKRSKDIEGFLPFGTEIDVTRRSYSFVRHSITAHEIDPPDFHVRVGSPEGRQARPSVLNISAMSFGALGPRAIEVMNLGAAKGGFYHCTGEGGLSPYHLKHGGVLPASKVAPEIAEARKVREGQDCISPPRAQCVPDAPGDVQVHRAAPRTVRGQARGVQALRRHRE